jgi:hypothetical protein
MFSHFPGNDFFFFGTELESLNGVATMMNEADLGHFYPTRIIFSVALHPVSSFLRPA